jgi:hypothetical protein
MQKLGFFNGQPFKFSFFYLFLECVLKKNLFLRTYWGPETACSGIQSLVMICKSYKNAYILAWSVCKWACDIGEEERSGKSGVVHGEVGEQVDRHAWLVRGEEGEESSAAGESAYIPVAW